MFKSSLTILFGILFCQLSSAQLRDTSLFTIYSRPFYYNVVKDWKGKIYAGSSDGMYQFQEATPIKMNDQKGYLMINKLGKVEIDSNGVKYHQQSSMSHMLPFPTEKRDEYHVGNDRYFYITSGGRMHVYEILPYAYRFRNHSIRSISSNFTGTYSGIYYHNQLLGRPVSNFTDGYIREYNGKVFMCTNGLDIFNISDIQMGNKLIVQKLPDNFNTLPTRDIRYIEKIKQYVVASDNQIAILDSNLKKVTEIFKSSEKADIKLLDEDKLYNTLYFSNAKTLYSINFSNNQVVNQGAIDEYIVDGKIELRTKYLLSSNGLYFQKGDGKYNKIIPLQKAHTMLSITEDAFVISTDEGLFLFRENENKIYPLIPGVEFNKKALFVDKNKLYAGSINGLYIIDLSQMDTIIARTIKMLSSEEVPTIPIWYFFLIIVLILILIVVMVIYKRRIKNIQSQITISNKGESKTKLNREVIESYINEHLPIASLKSIVDHFNTNNSMVYSLLSPNKPGDLIQQLRYEKVKALRQEGKTAKEISEVTGLSDSYIRKIWNH